MTGSFLFRFAVVQLKQVHLYYKALQKGFVPPTSGPESQDEHVSWLFKIYQESGRKMKRKLLK